MDFRPTHHGLWKVHVIFFFVLFSDFLPKPCARWTRNKEFTWYSLRKEVFSDGRCVIAFFYLLLFRSLLHLTPFFSQSKNVCFIMFNYIIITPAQVSYTISNYTRTDNMKKNLCKVTDHWTSMWIDEEVVPLYRTIAPNYLGKGFKVCLNSSLILIGQWWWNQLGLAYV